jgi:hypothetical protein
MTGRTQAEASLAERLRDHGTALAWLGRSLLVAEVIDVLEPET